jgi:hypothetical protein
MLGLIPVSVGARALPPRPNLEYLKNEAKRRLDAARPANPRLKLRTCSSNWPANTASPAGAS